MYADVVDLRDFYTSRLGQVARRMIAQGSGGRIVNISSIGGRVAITDSPGA